MAIFETVFGYEPPANLRLEPSLHTFMAFPLFHLPAPTLEQLGVFPSFVRTYQFEREYFHEQYEDLCEYMVSLDLPPDMDLDGEFREEWERFDFTGTVCDPAEVADWAARWQVLIARAQSEQDLNKLWPSPEDDWNDPPWDWNERAPCLLADLAQVSSLAECARREGIRLLCETYFRGIDDVPIG